uniref:PARP catalytic domain-containing protein n=1 Tax=Arcella intermedia TaxID=1963864 RepID=A0A6B2L129_9EUKA
MGKLKICDSEDEEEKKPTKPDTKDTRNEETNKEETKNEETKKEEGKKEEPQPPSLTSPLVSSTPKAKSFKETVSDFFSFTKKKSPAPSPSPAPPPSSSTAPTPLPLPVITTPEPTKTPPVSKSVDYSIVKALEKEGFNLKEDYKPGKTEGKISKSGQELNFGIGLVASVRKRLRNFNNYCIICHVKHSCERTSGRPVVCCEPLCLFRYSDLRVAEHLEECEVCPFLGCSAQDDILDDNHAVKLLYPEEEKQAGIPLKKLAEMHRHKYLPQAEFKQFVDSMGASGVRAKKVENILKADLVPRFENILKADLVPRFENILKADLVPRFEKKWQELRTKYPDMKIEPVLCWHGTSDASIEGIRKLGLLVPGKNNSVGHSNDSGWWGKGIYVSPIASYSMSYMRGNKGMFLVSVLMGKSCTLGSHERMDGQPARPGFDSHIAENGREYILFDEGQVLPCYLIEVNR